MSHVRENESMDQIVFLAVFFFVSEVARGGREGPSHKCKER